MGMRRITMDRAEHDCDHRRMSLANAASPDARDHHPNGTSAGWPAAADAIVQAGLWCVIEVGDDDAPGGWEPRLIICRTGLDDIAEVIALRIAAVPPRTERIAGYTRDTLVRVDSAPTALCYIAEPVAESA
jgi:hypothetical protein